MHKKHQNSYKDNPQHNSHSVAPKKSLGQHFLKDKNIAKQITDCLSQYKGYTKVLEIGAGMGVLTEFLLQRTELDVSVVEIDRDSVTYLKDILHFPANKIIEGDILRLNLAQIFDNQPIGIIGNLPYNISSQIFFKVLEFRNQIPEVVCMIQKEVAERIAAKHGNKTYGILSVLLQAFYTIDYQFTVHEHVFNPPPKVKSGVITLRRNEVMTLPCNEKLFFNVVKTGFNQRRKTLRNALKPLGIDTEQMTEKVFDQRAEQLSVQDFIELTLLLSTK
jgi:16S rRNA (adenine1518-N6/adenine1519-N6)-dimethyltransferase